MIVLPSEPLPQSANPLTFDSGSWQEPAFGGTITRIDRPGSHFGLSVTTPRLKPEPYGRIWVARLTAAIGDDVQFPWPQVGLEVGDPGAPVADGGGQAGTTLNLRGLTPGYVVREGQFFNLRIAAFDAWILYQAQAGDVVAGGDGKAAISVWPMLRLNPTDGAVTQWEPVIQGRLSGNEKGWTLARAGVQGLQFQIEERR